MARSADPVSYAAVVGCVYLSGIPLGVLAADYRAVREIEDALRIAEQSGDDLALTYAQMALGLALVHRPTAAEHNRGQHLLSQVSDAGVRGGYLLSELPIVDVYLARERARCGDRNNAIPLMRAAVDHLVRQGPLLGWGISATCVLVETLLDRGANGDAADADAAIERLAAAPADDRLVIREILFAAAAGAAGPRPKRRDRLSRLSGSLPRHGDIAWLRRTHGMGRGDAITAVSWKPRELVSE